MAQRSELTLSTFLATCEMVFSHLRLKEADRWSAAVCRLKYASFRAAFPEVDEAQFLWTAEQWIQGTDSERFERFPVWQELMAPLYRTEGGRANRSFGFRDDIPGFIAPTAQQIAMLPPVRRSIHAPPDPLQADAYRTVGIAGEAEAAGLPLRPAEPPARLAGEGIPQKEWDQYLESLNVASDDQRAGAAEDPGKGSDRGVLVDRPVQSRHQASGVSASRVSREKSAVLRQRLS